MNMTPMPQERAAEIARMNRYIQKTKGAEKTVYDMTLKEMGSLRDMTKRGKDWDAVELAFLYGRAKGYRAAKAEVSA